VRIHKRLGALVDVSINTRKRLRASTCLRAFASDSKTWFRCTHARVTAVTVDANAVVGCIAVMQRRRSALVDVNVCASYATLGQRTRNTQT
jgi:hypothetical protein